MGAWPVADTDQDDPKARLDALERKLADKRSKYAPKPHMDEHYSQAQQAWRMVIELVAGLGIGLGMGFGLDALFGTQPFLMIVFCLLGFVAGVRTMMRTANELNSEAATDAATVADEAKSEGGLVFHPMDQFIVKPLFGDAGEAVHWYTVTNVTLWMAIAVLAVVALMVLGTRGRAVVPSRTQSVAELGYGFVYKMVEDVAGKDGVRYFPYIMTLFLFIVFSNFLGLLPMSFTTTSHIAVTAVMAMAVFLAVTILGFVKHGVSFLQLFWISSAPLALRPILALIEVISYFVRPVSHSIRLAGNMMAGHAVIKVFATFAAVAAIAPLSILAITAIYALEVLVSFIQAYVFAILTCVYLKDALHPHH